MRRHTELRRTGWLARHVRVNPVNAKRRAKNSARAYGPKERREWLLAQPCLVCGRHGVQQAHTSHASAGMGHKGDACANVPLCFPHHLESGQGVKTFERKYEDELGYRTLAECAAYYDAIWQAIASLDGAA